MSNFLVRPGLKTALVESLYQEILTNTNSYYYFVGNTLSWDDDDVVPLPERSTVYEFATRRDSIFYKKITGADVVFSIPRYDWKYGEVFDQYDDSLGDIIEYSATGNNNVFHLTGTFDPSKLPIGYVASGTNIAAGAKIVAVTPTRIDLDKRHTGSVNGVIKFTNVAYSGATSLEEAKFYCVTSDFHVYKCLNNNSNSLSTARPYATSYLPITTEDGYVWKYIYTIPRALVNKFMTQTEMPVTNALKTPFYSSGALLDSVVDSYGANYQIGDYISVNGDGYLKENPIRIISVAIEDFGSNYSSFGVAQTTPSITVEDPFETIDYEDYTPYLLGSYIKNSTGKIYEVVTPGTSVDIEPNHTSYLPVQCGTLQLKFVGITPPIVATIGYDASSPDFGEILSVSMTGIVGYLFLRNPGYGYVTPPNVNFVRAPTTGGQGASASTTIANGRVTTVNLLERGSGYSDISAVFDPPFNVTNFNRISFTYDTSLDSTVNQYFNLIEDTFTIPNHGFETGDAVTYGNYEGFSFGNLTNGQKYYIIKLNNNTFKIATTYFNSTNNANEITFDGSLSQTVNISTNIITYTNHGFTSGELVRYVASNGTAIGGLVSGNLYHVRAINTNELRLVELPIAITNDYSLQKLASNAPINFTINGSSASVVNTAGSFITYNQAYRYGTGTRVRYSRGLGGTAIGGLTHLQLYYFIAVSTTTFQLATSYQNALDGIAVSLTSVGGGALHGFDFGIDLSALGTGNQHKLIRDGIPLSFDSGAWANGPVDTHYFEDNVDWVSGMLVSNNQYIRVPAQSGADRFYQVVFDSGYVGSQTTLGSTQPIHTRGSVASGDNAELKFVGMTATADVQLMYGYGYSTVPRVIVEPPFTEDYSWEAGLSVPATTVGLPTIIKHNNVFYQISSGLFSFNSSSSSVVDIVNNTINYPGHNLITGTLVGYVLDVPQTSTQIDGLIDGDNYYAIRVNDSLFKLGSTLFTFNGSSGAVVNLNSDTIVNNAALQTGTITSLTTSRSISGSGTSFTRDWVGYNLYDATTDTLIGTIESYVSPTSVILTTQATTNYTGVTFKRAIGSGQQVFYHTDGTVVGGLTNQEPYYIIRSSANTIKLAKTKQISTINRIVFSASSNVDYTNNQINFSNHGFIPGLAVTYRTGGDTAISGLTSNTTYYCNVQGNDSFRLSLTYENAIAPIQIISFNPAVSIDIDADSLQINNHQLTTGTPVTYNSNGGVTITGLVNNTLYYIIKVNDNVIKLATNPTNAGSGVAIDINSAGTGTSHYFDRSINLTSGSTGNAHEFDPAINLTSLGTTTTHYLTKPVDLYGLGTGNHSITGFTSQGVGNLGSTPPTHLSGSNINGDLVLSFLGKTASLSFTVEKTNAVLTPIIENGQVVGVISSQPGVGYTTAAVEVISQTGYGAIITPLLSVGDIESRQANVELLAIPGTVDNIEIINPGFQYYGTPSITVTGDGTGCTAICTTKDGVITNITVTNAGSNYTFANVTIESPSDAYQGGIQAYARAIISPASGHGYNAIREFNTKSIVLATTLANDKNQGFIVPNDYRQTGIIKNPRKYKSLERLDSFTGSACYIITANFNYSALSIDMQLLDTQDNEYRIVSIPPSSEVEEGANTIAILIQSIDNANLAVGGILRSGNNDLIGQTLSGSTTTVTISAISNPTVDKYSGELLFIDNRSGFAPTSEQVISLKTVIKL